MEKLIGTKSQDQIEILEDGRLSDDMDVSLWLLCVFFRRELVWLSSRDEYPFINDHFTEKSQEYFIIVFYI